MEVFLFFMKVLNFLVLTHTRDGCIPELINSIEVSLLCIYSEFRGFK